jgi:hypothetical protein
MKSVLTGERKYKSSPSTSSNAKIKKIKFVLENSNTNPIPKKTITSWEIKRLKKGKNDSDNKNNHPKSANDNQALLV